MSAAELGPATRAVEESTLACRALHEEAARLAAALDEGQLRAARQGEDLATARRLLVPLQAIGYTAKIARAGFETPPPLARLGPALPAVLSALRAVEGLPWSDFLFEAPELLLETFHEKLRRLNAGFEPARRHGNAGGAKWTVEGGADLPDPAATRATLHLFAEMVPFFEEILDQTRRSSRLCLVGPPAHVRTVARLIHHLSPNAWGPFVTANSDLERLAWLPPFCTVLIPNGPLPEGKIDSPARVLTVIDEDPDGPEASESVLSFRATLRLPADGSRRRGRRARAPVGRG